jgi:hypothetical protein
MKRAKLLGMAFICVFAVKSKNTLPILNFRLTCKKGVV